MPDNILDQNMLPVAQHLARFDLCLTTAHGDEQAYALLSGSTFPFDQSLHDSGARWEPDNQIWTLCSEEVLQNFLAILDRTHENDLQELAEEVAPFTSTHDLETPLSRLQTLGPNALGNKELLELLLSFDSFLADPSAMSRQLFDELGSLGAVLACETGRLAQFTDVTPRICSLLKAVQLTIERVLHEPVQQNPIIGSMDALLDYLRGRLQHRQREEFLVLYLNRKNRLIKIEETQGSISHVKVYPRDIVARALELFASSIIVAHNHPSGAPEPSRGDVEITRQLGRALDSLEIVLYDHVIVGTQSLFSFKHKGLI